MRHLFHILLALSAGLASSASAQVPPPTAAAPQSAVPAERTNDAEYILGAGDVVEVDVLGQGDFKTRAKLRTDGSITLPLIGNIAAAGETSTSFAQRVAAALSGGGYYVSPIVSVEVVGYSSRYVIVLGAVGQPGLVPVDREYRVSEILARVGGVRDSAAETINLIRADGQEFQLAYEQVATGTPQEDPLVEAGDKLFVPLAETFYIYGQVNAPGSYSLKDEMSLRQAIARSGGLTASGSDKRVSIFRKGQKVKLSLDEAVQAGDVVVIGERFF